MEHLAKSRPQLVIEDRLAAEERAIACAALYGPEVASEVLDLLPGANFRDDAARAVWEGMEASWSDRRMVSELDLLSRGLSPDQLRPVKDHRDGVELMDPMELVRSVQAMHAIDEVAMLCRAQAANAATQSASVSALRGWVGDMVLALEASLERVSVREHFATARDAFARWVEMQQEVESSWRATWGLSQLDEALGGLQPGTLHVPIGLPGHGKSSLACTAAVATAKRGMRVLYVSREMQDPEMGLRFAAISSGIPRQGLEKRIQDGQSMDAIESLVPQNVIPDGRSRTMADVRAKVRMAAAQGDPFHLVILDYIQLFRGPGDGSVDVLSQLIYGAKDMAMDNNCAVIALAQVNRQNDGTTAPTMRQIKGASAIEDAADSVVSIFKAKEFQSDGDTEWFDYSIGVEKARNGRPGDLDGHRLVAGTFRVRPNPEMMAETIDFSADEAQRMSARS